jgi:diguanylate cyclase (GGDEF)-like protein/PAS domain S-box-containing protein
MIRLNVIEIQSKNWIVFIGGWIGIIIGIVGVCLSDDQDWIKFFDDLHWTSATSGAALLAWQGYRQSTTPEIASTRRWFALGFGAYAIGQVIWDIQTLLGYNQFPATSDLFYLCLGPCQFIGLLTEIRANRQRSNYKVIFLDTLALSVAALTLVLVLYLPKRGDLDFLSLFVLIAYPASLLIVTSTVLMMIPSLRLRISFNLMLFIFASMVTAWSWMRWNLLALTGTIIDGDLFNASFSIAVLLAGFSITFRQIEVSQQPKWDKWCEGLLRFLPLLNVLLACAAVIAVSADGSESSLEKQLTLVGALTVILLAFIRQGVLLKEHEQLLLTQSLLRTVLDTVPLRVFWKDNNCQYLGSNTVFAHDAGLSSPDALLGKNDYQLNWRKQAQLYQADDKAVMSAMQAKLNYEEPQHTPDGRTIWIRTSKVPLLDREGEVIGILGVYDDITQLKEYQDKLMLTAKVFEHTEEGIMITNADRELIDVNEAFSKITGYSREEVLGKNPRFLKSGYHDDDFYQMLWQIIHAVGHWNGEIWNRKKNGDVYPEWITISAITDDVGIVSHYVGIFSDISLLKQHEKQLKHIAHYDALTGIPNRVLLVDRMKQAIAQTHRDKKMLAVCYLDLDGFKPINDSNGHHIGDLVLIKISERIAHTIREGDTLARLGGDEFVILLLGLEKMDDCIHSMERLLENISKPIVIGNQLVTVTASIGVTIYPTDDYEADALLRHADQAMYKAKQSGKNRYFLYDANADQQAHRRQQFMDEISQGLDSNQFELFYQPKVAMTDRKVVGVEALIRWYHPEQGLLSPRLFLPMIENSTLEIKLGDWVINHALAQMVEWQTHGHDISVSVNIAGSQLLDLNFIDKLRLAFANYPTISSSLLELEILETTALEIERSCAVIMTACSELGVSFALDDFGTGYSTLTYLKQLPVSTLKIDQSFVRDMLEDVGDRAIVEGVIALATVFGRKTVAEGVETEQHFLALRDMGCQIAQGYAIARPMPAKVFYEWYLASLATNSEESTTSTE